MDYGYSKLNIIYYIDIVRPKEWSGTKGSNYPVILGLYHYIVEQFKNIECYMAIITMTKVTSYVI